MDYKWKTLTAELRVLVTVVTAVVLTVTEVTRRNTSTTAWTHRVMRLTLRRCLQHIVVLHGLTR